MRSMTSAEVRRAFLEYFIRHQHQEVASSSLVPANDPTLLFTNAGMVQFKDVFLGMDKRPYTRATTAQKVMRVSGKHNDLENVGFTARHHTFFEMLGNFSFGDYFKKDAIRFAYEVLTDVFGLPADRLYFVVHEKDDESYNIWVNEIGVPTDHVYRLGDKTNFWQMADTGPCGYTSEIHWDWEPEKGQEAIGAELDDTSGRLLELWNLVFMQFNQSADGTRVPLPRPGVDTGLGFERLVSVLQNVRWNYETDIFVPIIKRVQELNGATDTERDADIVPYRVIADHARAAAFLIAEGVIPGPKDRGYVCRIVIRRAARFGARIGFAQPFLADVADAVIETMGEHYSELKTQRDAIRKAITQEEVRFRRTLDRGMVELESDLAALPKGGTLSGEKAFFLKSTLGLPFEVMRDVAMERGYQVDEAGFLKAQADHEIASGGGQDMGIIDLNEAYSATLKDLQTNGALTASGVAYDPYSGTERAARLIGLLRDGQAVTSATVGDRVEAILDATPFYVESGGQVSDTGVISGDGWTIDVEDMRRPVGGLIIHIGEVVEGTLHVGDSVTARVDSARRLNIMRNHTATHILHAQLRAILGTHVHQRGSLVAPDRLRFDFNHDAPVSPAEQMALTTAINTAVLADMPVANTIKDLAVAKEEGAMALFGEKYPNPVRTVTIGENSHRYSYELCGGTHVRDTATIGSFVIVGEGSVGQGVRRIEALTGPAAQTYIQQQMQTLHAVADQLTTTPDQVIARVTALREEVSSARRDNDKLRRQIAHLTFAQLYAGRTAINGAQVLIAEVESTPADTLREMADWFRDQAKSGVLVFGTVIDGKPSLLAAVTDDLTKKVHAGNLIKTIAATVGGGGGGRPNLAQAGGKDADRLPEALAQAREQVMKALTSL